MFKAKWRMFNVQVQRSTFNAQLYERPRQEWQGSNVNFNYPVDAVIAGLNELSGSQNKRLLSNVSKRESD